MKPVVAEPQTRVLCMRIVPITGSTVYLTDYPVNLIMGGHTYLSTSGYEFTGHSSTAGFSPASLDLTGIAQITGISIAQVSSGLFDGARMYVFATSWLTPVEDEEEVLSGVFGATEVRDDKYVIYGTSLIDVLNQSVGQLYQALCPKVFCGTEYAGCGVPLAANTVTGTVTSVTSDVVFRDSARTEAVDIFAYGLIRFTDGPNSGLKAREIKSYLANGTVELFEPFQYPVTAGDDYSMVRGCRKRLEDCKARWNGTATYSNVANFGGFPWVPVGSEYGKLPT